MITTVQAAYKGGTLHPDRPLPLSEGEFVNVTVITLERSSPSTQDDKVSDQLKAAQSIDEWLEATKQLPSDDGGYDILEALNTNRILSGEHPLLP